MNIKKTANLLINFAIKRLAEIFGIVISLSGLALLAALVSFSPDDPNFIFPENTQIKNLLGFQGSFISDLFFQSIGLVSYLVSLTFLITGINIFVSKDFFLIIENIFFSVLYSIFATLFLTYYYSDVFSLYINGNGGFVGNYFNQTFFKSLILLNESISYYFLIVLTLILFSISINFKPIKFNNFIRKIFNLFQKNNNNIYTNKSEIINEYIPQDEIKNLIQEDLPFIKNENQSEKNAAAQRLPQGKLFKK